MIVNGNNKIMLDKHKKTIVKIIVMTAIFFFIVSFLLILIWFSFLADKLFEPLGIRRTITILLRA